ncbi:hypothetical protein B0H13DRAFT_1882101 [Mycena leptocephala]|nr:hypothetical protein B0H13DRAFT_1882101 [Mycena leptocephala]
MPKVNGALLPNKACLSCKRRKTRSNAPRIVNGPQLNCSPNNIFDPDGIIAALAKFNERLDFLETKIFGWTLPIEQVHHKQTPQGFEEASNPWAEALARHRKVAGQSLSGSTADDSSYDTSISAHASGSGSSSNFLFDFDTFPWDDQRESYSNATGHM